MNQRWMVFRSWLRQRPWMIVPLFALIPWVGIPLLNQVVPKPATVAQPGEGTGDSQVLGVADLAIANRTAATPATVAPSPVVTPSPTSSPQANSAAKPVPKPATNTAARSTVQPLMNLSVDAAIPMRVLIHKGASQLAVGASEGGAIFDAQTNQMVYQLPARSRYEMAAAGDGIVMGAAQLPALIWIDASPTGVIYVGDRAYRGKMLVVRGDSGLWVVNYVNMQHYLYSVVGSEVSPSWPMEALKAQAVAARSYALTYHLKPVKQDLFDLGADEYYQVYKGIESEAPETRQAVNGTSGEFVSYRGGVVESLYAATDDIVMEAFQGKGMSQIGALGLAEQGRTYREILATYYTGTGVARVEMAVE